MFSWSYHDIQGSDVILLNTEINVSTKYKILCSQNTLDFQIICDRISSLEELSDKRKIMVLDTLWLSWICIMVLLNHELSQNRKLVSNSGGRKHFMAG